MNKIIFLATIAFASECFAEDRALIYLYSTNVSDYDHTFEQTLEGKKVFERFESVVVSDVDPNLKIVAVDTAKISTDVRDKTGKAGPIEIQELSRRLAQEISAKVSREVLIEGVVFYGHGNKDLYEFNGNAFSAKTFSRVVASLLGQLNVSSQLFVHFAGCHMGADVTGGAKNFQFRFLENLAEEVTAENKIKFDQIDTTAHVYGMNSNGLVRTGILERILFRAKIPGIINRFFVRISPHPVASLFIDLAPAFAGMALVKFGTFGEPGSAIIGTSLIGVTVLARLGGYINSQIVKRMTYNNGQISEAKGFFDEQAKAALLHSSCEDLNTTIRLVKPQ